MQEIATVSKGAASLHGRVPSHLLHPLLIWVDRDPGDVYLAALKMDEKQDVVCHQSAQREHHYQHHTTWLPGSLARAAVSPSWAHQQNPPQSRSRHAPHRHPPKRSHRARKASPRCPVLFPGSTSQPRLEMRWLFGCTNQVVRRAWLEARHAHRV